MREVHVLSMLNTSRSASRAAAWLRENRPTELFLELPPACEDYLRVADYTEALNLMVEDGLLTPEEAGMLRLEPLLRAAEGCRIHCYLDPLHQLAKREFLQDVLLLSLRARVSGRVDVERWRSAAGRLLKAEERAGEREAAYIASKCTRRGACINLSESACRVLERRGIPVRTHVLAEASKPVDILLGLLRKERSGSSVPDEELERCIRAHLRFLELVETLGYEDAVLRLSSQQDA